MVNGWKNTRLVDLMHIETGSRNTEHRIDGGKYPFFVRSQQVERIDNYNYDCEAVLTAGDGVGTGKVFHYITGKFDAHQRVYVMSQFNGIDGKYFFYFFSANFLSEVEKYTAKSSVDSVRRNMIAEMKIPLPPLPEQHAIAAALSDADAYIAVLERLIVKKRSVKQGAMQEMLTGKRRLPGFEDEWVEKKVVELARIFGRIGFRGYTKQDIVKEKQGAISLSPSNIENGRVNFCNSTYISWEKYKESPEIMLQVGDVVLVKTGSTFGKTAYIEFLPWESTLNPQIVVFKEITADNRFFGYLLAFDEFQKLINNTIVGGAIPTLSQAQVYKFILKIPPTTAEQAAIAAILSDMDAEIDALTAKLNKLRNIKQGMMSELLTGHIRLTEQEAEATPEAVAAPRIVELQKREPAAATQTGGHNQQFDDAVMIAGIVNALYSDKFPLGRKKVQKCLYLLRRHQDESTAAFKKKAAGPYADEVRYRGGEPIARSANYIATTTAKDKGTTFARGKNISQALVYIESWGKQGDIRWVADKLKFKKVDELELLATVDMAICDLDEAGTPVSVAAIKHLIATNAEWKAKLKRQAFSDANIARAIRELQTLLQGGN